MEVRYKTSPTTNFTAWVDGVQIASINGHNATGVYQYVFFGMINMCCQGSEFDLTNWIDNLAISTSRIYPSSVITIGNSPDYATAVKVYQAPVYLSDTSAQFTLNLTGLGSGSYYLWVTNNRQERSVAYPINRGGDIPSAPTDLRIINN